MVMGEVDDARAETNRRRLLDDGGEKHQRSGYLLRLGGEMLPDPDLGESQLLGEQHGFPVFAQSLPPRLLRSVQRHGKHAELHEYDALDIKVVAASRECRGLALSAPIQCWTDIQARRSPFAPLR